MNQFTYIQMMLTSDIRLITTSFRRSWTSRTSRVFSPVVRRRTRTYRGFLIGCISLKIKKKFNKSKYYISNTIFSLIFLNAWHLLSQWHISLLFPTVEIKKRSRFHTLMKIDIFTCDFFTIWKYQKVVKLSYLMHIYHIKYAHFKRFVWINNHWFLPI